MPARSKPASVAACITAALISAVENIVDGSINQNCVAAAVKMRFQFGSGFGTRAPLFLRQNIFLTASAYSLLLTESRNSRCAFSEFFCKESTCMPQPTHAQTPTIQISVINESTVLNDADIVPVVAALQKQVTNDFRPVWGTDA